ncbi:hypothetical protein ACFFX0_28560 [Citricoccus parietis]|uniref:Uncharacterized protein n=1 Tax=Citricoccus parietis TaxID=592307 RepID=A0ABV5G7J0_9MICC
MPRANCPAGLPVVTAWRHDRVSCREPRHHRTRSGPVLPAGRCPPRRPLPGRARRTGAGRGRRRRFGGAERR